MEKKNTHKNKGKVIQNIKLKIGNLQLVLKTEKKKKKKKMVIWSNP